VKVPIIVRYRGSRRPPEVHPAAIPTLRRAPRRLALVSISLAVLGSLVLVALQTPPFHVYWVQPDQARMTRDVGSLARIMPTLEQFRLEGFYDRDGCRTMAYSGGSFASSNASDCRRTIAGVAVDFTPKANDDFTSIAEALNSTGVWVNDVDQIEHDASGRITSAEFQLIPEPLQMSGWSYIYDPGAPLPADFEGQAEYTRIDSNWYFYVDEFL
jgi:hypothetical protein